MTERRRQAIKGIMIVQLRSETKEEQESEKLPAYPRRII